MSSSSWVSSNESTRLSNVFAASKSSGVLVAAGRSDSGTSDRLTTKSGNVMSACAGSKEGADVDGTATGASAVMSPSAIAVLGGPIILCADILDADGALLGR